jgi:hypothetical protein
VADGGRAHRPGGRLRRPPPGVTATMNGRMIGRRSRRLRGAPPRTGCYWTQRS